jgi:hypothetical protein
VGERSQVITLSAGERPRNPSAPKPAIQQINRMRNPGCAQHLDQELSLPCKRGSDVEWDPTWPGKRLKLGVPSFAQFDPLKLLAGATRSGRKPANQRPWRGGKRFN